MKAKIAITLEEELLGRLDALAKRRGFNRSAFMERLLWQDVLSAEMGDAHLEQERTAEAMVRQGVSAEQAVSRSLKSDAAKRYRALDDEFARRFPDEWMEAHGLREGER